MHEVLIKHGLAGRISLIHEVVLHKLWSDPKFPNHLLSTLGLWLHDQFRVARLELFEDGTRCGLDAEAKPLQNSVVGAYVEPKQPGSELRGAAVDSTEQDPDVGFRRRRARWAGMTASDPGPGDTGWEAMIQD